MIHKKSMEKSTEVTHSFRTINGTKIHIAEIGKGEPLVLLHGWPQHWYVWRKVIPDLAKKYHLIMPDIRGFGWSDAPKNMDYRKETLADDLLAIVDSYDFKQIGLIGHDWGAWIGFLACLKKPEKFKAFLALGIMHPYQVFDTRIFQLWRGAYQVPFAFPILGEQLLKRYPSYIESLIKKATYQPILWSKKELEIYSHVLQSPAPAHASSLLYRTFLSQEFLPIMNGKYHQQELLTKTRLIVGENDPIISPPQLKGFENYAKDMKLEIIKDCGHFIPEEKPEIVIKEAFTLFT